MIDQNTQGPSLKSTNIAVVFPGQGSQRPGMGKDFYENIAVCRHTYEEASDTLGWDVSAMCFSEDDRLDLTEYAQPCILTTEIAMLRALESLYGFQPKYFGGHSLGEYTALVAAHVLPFSEALKTVNRRGYLMQQASPVGIGSMAAVILNNLDPKIIDKSLKGLQVDIANVNSSNQIVISGKSTSLKTAEQRIRKLVEDIQSFRFVQLNVSAAFHSRFMNAVIETFKDFMHSIAAKLKPENAKYVTSNYTGTFHTAVRADIVENLVAQLNGTVQWRKNMDILSSCADSIFEIGPGRPLRNFFKSMNVDCVSLTTLSSINKAFSKE